MCTYVLKVCLRYTETRGSFYRYMMCHAAVQFVNIMHCAHNPQPAMTS